MVRLAEAMMILELHRQGLSVTTIAHRTGRGRSPARTAWHRQELPALAVEAVRAGKAVYLISLAKLIAQLAKAERERALRGKLRFLTLASLLVVDEIGYLPVTPGGVKLFFQLVTPVTKKAILTSNRGFAEWGEVFADPVVATALLDSLLHHAVVIWIKGSSYRMLEHGSLAPENVRNGAASNPPLQKRRGRPPMKGKNDLEYG